jgi:putative ABC transport system ATP-binding protein
VADAGEARAALDRVGLADRARTCRASSRAANSSACASRARSSTNPELLLADEPTGNLDEDNESKVLTLFAELHAEGTRSSP